jgi:hypothetical protein
MSIQLNTGDYHISLLLHPHSPAARLAGVFGKPIWRKRLMDDAYA